jgi:hypothetical protein
MLFMPICGIGGVPGVTIGQTCISAPIRIAGDFSIKTFEHPGPITVPPCPVNDPSFVAGPGIVYLPFFSIVFGQNSYSFNHGFWIFLIRTMGDANSSDADSYLY